MEMYTLIPSLADHSDPATSRLYRRLTDIDYFNISEFFPEVGMEYSNQKRSLLQVAREEMLLRGYSMKTVKSYLSWLRSFITFIVPRHPRELHET